jgi:molybdenum cofactor guanylyltransferase
MPNDPKTLTTVSVLVLAGGRGLRLRGRDKGLISLWGKPMIEHVLGRVAQQAGGTLISANRNSETYARYGFPVLADAIGHEWGPLAGIYTALKFVSSEYLLVVPCDSPCLPADLCQRLMAALQSGEFDVALAHDGERAQFTVSLIRCSLATRLLDYLENGERRVESWLRQQRLVEVSFADEADAFTNVNSPDDLESMEQRGGC